MLSAPLVQSASSDEEKYDERRDIGQKSQQYSDTTKQSSPSELKKARSTPNPNSHNGKGHNSPTDEKKNTPIGGTGNR